MTGPSTPRRASRRRSLLAALATGGLASVAGCASEFGSPSETDPSQPPVEVLHNWTSGPNKLASESLAAAFRDANPEIPADVRPVADADVDDLLVRRVEGDDPPEAVGTVPGENTAPFADSLAAVGDAWTTNSTDAHPPLAREACRRNGAYRAVPIAAFRVDAAYYNADVLDTAGVDPASLSSVDGLLAAVEAVASSSATEARPFTHAVGRPRPTLRLFAALLAADPGAYHAFVSGEESRSAVREAVAATSRLLAAVGDDPAEVQIEAGRRVGSGEAAFVQSGSWLSASLRRAGFGHRSEGGTAGSWGFVGLADAPVVLYDAFVSPTGSASPEGAAAWLAFAGSATGQTAFNGPPSAAARPDPSPEDRKDPPVPRGSVPPRIDVSPNRFDPPLTAVARAYRDADERLPSMAHGLAFPPATLDALLGAVDERLVNADAVDVDAAADALVAAVADT